jgi:hypothetical protein
LQPFEIGEPDLDERPDRVLEARPPSRLERVLVAFARLRRIDSLLEAVVAGHQELLDPVAGVVPLHKPSVTRQDLLET